MLISDGTSSSSSSLTTRFYKGSLNVSEARARRHRKMVKLKKGQARKVWNEPDFCPKIKHELGSIKVQAQLNLEHNFDSKLRLELPHIFKKHELVRLGKFTVCAITNADILVDTP